MGAGLARGHLQRWAMALAAAAWVGGCGADRHDADVPPTTSQIQEDAACSAQPLAQLVAVARNAAARSEGTVSDEELREAAQQARAWLGDLDLPMCDAPWLVALTGCLAMVPALLDEIEPALTDTELVALLEDVRARVEVQLECTDPALATSTAALVDPRRSDTPPPTRTSTAPRLGAQGPSPAGVAGSTNRLSGGRREHPMTPGYSGGSFSSSSKKQR